MQAVNGLHSSIFKPFKRWTDHTYMEVRWVGRRHATRSATGKHWWPSITVQQERDITLYLLLWGEAANLRFMPELLFFLFAVARAHVRDAFDMAGLLSALDAQARATTTNPPRNRQGGPALRRRRQAL